eukprot:TRINITY_DN3887_c0_g2_i1.p1 TRINITY_DN3887_c0_g2~~TRINITY_DN3887_c0_g2_i1.p1  ORF type:complete len:742 (-),score=204.19 TRINITY_DN3887_c0_g2_i1:213-2438(-)
MNLEIKTGYLVKQGRILKNWKKRWFVLTSDSLSYKETKDSADFKGIIPINIIVGLQIIEDVEIATFAILTDDRTYEIQAETEQIRDEWLHAIAKTQVEPSRLTMLLREASDLARDGKITAEEKLVIKSMLAGSAQQVKKAETKLKTGRWEGDESQSNINSLLTAAEAEEGLEMIFETLEELLHALIKQSTSKDIITILNRVRQLAMQKMLRPGSSASLVASVANLLVGDLWTSDVQTTYSNTLRTVRKTEMTSRSDVSSCPASPESKHHRFLDIFEVMEMLGEGGYSVVRRCRHKRTKEDFAVKIIDTRKLKKTDVDHIKHEVNIMKELEHPNIVKLFDCFEEDPMFFIVTELCTGGELFEQVVERTFYSEREARDLVSTLANALQFMHKRGIVHRDVKPENILLSSRGPSACLKLADMGFAKQLFAGDTLATSCGTPNYVAPEILNRKKYDSQVDMWSLGVVTYILLCGYAPFHSRNHAQMYRLIKRGEFKFASPYWDPISKHARDFISRLLCVDSAKRMTAEQALQHQWIRGSVAETELGGALKELRFFNIMRKKVIKKGMLTKQGHFVKNWKRRSFVLTGESLSYYEGDSSIEPKGKINLRDIVGIDDVRNHKDPHAFRIRTSNNKFYVIVASSLAEKQEWQTAIRSMQQKFELMNKAKAAFDTEQMQAAVDLVKMATQWDKVHQTAALLPPEDFIPEEDEVDLDDNTSTSTNVNNEAQKRKSRANSEPPIPYHHMRM